MKSLRTIASTALFFGLVGPAAGGLICVLTCLVPLEGGPIPVFLASYLMGIIPAVLAGIAYGVVRIRTGDSLKRWHLRAFWGLISGVSGSLLFSMGVFLSGTMPPGNGFPLTITVLGALAGASCAVLLRPKHGVGINDPTTG